MVITHSQCAIVNDQRALDDALVTEDDFAVDALDKQAALALTGNPLFAGGYTYRTDAQFHSTCQCPQYVAGKAVGRPSTVEQQVGTLIETVMPVRRPAAVWGLGLVYIHSPRSYWFGRLLFRNSLPFMLLW